MSLILVTRDDAVATVTLNRPEAMNALSRALRAELAAAMRDLAADGGVRAIVLTGAGTRAFTAGLDLTHPLSVSRTMRVRRSPVAVSRRM